MKSFGEIIRIQRETKCLPLRKVAAALDIDSSLLSKIERGERCANKVLVISAADFFGLEADELLTQFYSDQVAESIYNENFSEEILKIAEQKVKYLKNKYSIQTNLEF